MNSVSPEEIESYGKELNQISSKLKDHLLEIKNNLFIIKESIQNLENYNGKNASEVYFEKFERTTDPSLLLNGVEVPSILKNYYQNRWVITVENKDINEATNWVDDTIEQIESLNLCGDDLVEFSEILHQFIDLIEKQILVNRGYRRSSYNDYQNLTDLFTTIKDNDIYKEYKKESQYASKVKKEDLLYQKYRSKGKNSDYVDYLLDEMGNHRLETDNQNTKYGYWYNQNYSMMNYNDAFCAAGVTYALVSSGNQEVLNPYINVSLGAEDAKQKASEGKGEWHDATDATYQPKRGDIFFKGGDHTGIVLDSDESYLYTIEANTSSDEGISGYVNTRIRNRKEDPYLTEGGYYSPPVQININANDQEITMTKEYLDKKINIQNGNNE